MLRRLIGELFTLQPISRKRRAAIVLGMMLAMTVFGAVDMATRNSAEWSIAYAVCVAVAAWYGGPWAGIPLALYAGVLSFVTAAVAGGPAAAGEQLAAFPIAIILVLFATSLVGMRRSLTEATQLARTDPLTGAANSRAFYETAGAELARVRRYGGILTLAYFDVDDFKSVNERFGHAAGDALLKALVRSLAEATRDTDSLARMGGDEFVLLMPETDQEAASVVLEKLAAHSRERLSHQRWNIGVSIGAVTFVAPPASVASMVGEADEAMYAAKRAGKGRAVLRSHPAQAEPAPVGRDASRAPGLEPPSEVTPA